MLVSKRREIGLVFAQVYFSDSVSMELKEIADCDVVSFIFAKQPIPGAHPRRTLCLDLRLGENELWSDLGKTNRYKIRRAQERDNLAIETINHPRYEQIEEFSKFYDVLAARKGLRTNRLKTLLALNESGGLILSRVYGRDQAPICWHAYIADGTRASLLYSASHLHSYASSAERGLVGRANRYLHWIDVKTFRDAGYTVYDFGGVSGADSDGTTVGIDEFKRQFGGHEVTEYMHRGGRSPIGKLAMLAWRAVDLHHEIQRWRLTRDR